MTISLGKVPVCTPEQEKQRLALIAEAGSLSAALAKVGSDAKARKALEVKIAANKAKQVTLKNNATKVKGLSAIAKEGAILPDPDATFLIDYRHEIQSDDTVEISAPDRLLTLVETKSKDRTSDIVAKVGGAAADLAVFGSTGGFGNVLSLEGLNERKALPNGKPVHPCAAEQDYTATATIDPANPSLSFKSLREAMRARTNLNCLTLTVVDGNGKELFNSEKPRDVSLASVAAPEKCSTGICYRTRGAVFYRLSHKHSAVAGTFGMLNAPQIGPIGVIDFKRRAFVETSVRAEFSKGMLTTVKYSDPSELLGLIGIPVNIVETIVGIPSKLVETEQGQLDAQKAVLEAQTSILDQRLKLLEAQEALAAQLAAADE